MKKLSNREKEIINLLRQGLSNKSIALKLNVEPKTVSTYIQRIRLKLELPTTSNTYQIVATYQRLNFPITKEIEVCDNCQEINCECGDD